MSKLSNILRSLVYIPIICVYACYFNPFSTKKVDDQLKPYVDEALVIGNEVCPSRIESHSSYEIQFNDDDPEVAAYCQKRYFRFYIYVNKKHWNKYTEDDRYNLIFHEAGHCIFDLNHSDNPNNYMYYAMVDIPKPIVIEQAKRDMRKHCEK